MATGITRRVTAIGTIERRRYGAVERCRTEVTRRINRYGERVIRRERVCD